MAIVFSDVGSTYCLFSRARVQNLKIKKSYSMGSHPDKRHNLFGVVSLMYMDYQAGTFLEISIRSTSIVW